MCRHFNVYAHEAGIKVIMVTGDQPLTAAAIARQVNIITQPKTVNDFVEEGVDWDKAMELSDAVVYIKMVMANQSFFSTPVAGVTRGPCGRGKGARGVYPAKFYLGTVERNLSDLVDRSSLCHQGFFLGEERFPSLKGEAQQPQDGTS